MVRVKKMGVGVYYDRGDERKVKAGTPNGVRRSIFYNPGFTYVVIRGTSTAICRTIDTPRGQVSARRVLLSVRLKLRTSNPEKGENDVNC